MVIESNELCAQHRIIRTVSFRIFSKERSYIMKRKVNIGFDEESRCINSGGRVGEE
jgi:hypothetical protein